MKVRTFLFILLMLAGIALIGTFFEANGDLLRQELTVWEGASITVGWGLLIACFIGVGATFLAGLGRQVAIQIERRGLRKASRKSEEIEEEYSRGLVAVLEGRETEALGHYRAVLERDSKHFNTLLKLGEVLRSLERYDEAIECHRKAHHLKEDNTQPLYALVEDYEAKGEMDRARAVLGKIIGINKNSVSAWRKLRSLHMKERHWADALEAHGKVDKLSGRRSSDDMADRRFGVGIRYEIAASRLEAGKTRDALGLLRRLIKDESSFIPAHVLLGEALLEDAQEGEAVAAWFRGFESTGSPIFLSVLEEHYLQREQPLAAIEALKRCIAQARNDTLARFYLGKLYFRLEMLDDAQTTLAALEARATYAPTLHYLLGRIHERRDKHGAAVLEYRKVIKEMDLVQLEYKCRACGETFMDWTARCTRCGEWNVVEVNFREEISLEELGVAVAPLYPSPR